MSKIKSVFGGAPKQDKSALEAQKAQIAKQNADLATQEEDQRKAEAAKLRTRKGTSGAGGNTLLTGLETGLRDTLG